MRCSHLFATCVGVLLAASFGRAQTSGSWNANASDNWSNATRWSGGFFPDSGGIATLGGVIRQSQSINIDAATTFTLSTLQFTNINSNGGYSLVGTGTTAFSAGGGSIVNTASSNSLIASLLDFGVAGTTITGNGSGGLTIGNALGASGNLTINTTALNRELGIVYFGFTLDSLYAGNINLQQGTLGLVGSLGTGTISISGPNQVMLSAAAITRIKADAALNLTNGSFRILGATGTSGDFTQASTGTATATGYSSFVVQPSGVTTEGITLAFAGGLSRTNRGTFLFAAPNSLAFGGSAGVGVARLQFGATDPAGMAGNPSFGFNNTKIIPLRRWRHHRRWQQFRHLRR